MVEPGEQQACAQRISKDGCAAWNGKRRAATRERGTLYDDNPKCGPLSVVVKVHTEICFTSTIDMSDFAYLACSPRDQVTKCL